MDDNERESLTNKIAELEATIESCTTNYEDGKAMAAAFLTKRARCRRELAALKRRLAQD